MSRKDFILIADVLHSYAFTDPQDKVNLSNRFADALRTTNAMFNRWRFMDAVNQGRKSKGQTIER